MTWITAKTLAWQFGPRVLAGEIMSDALRLTLFRSPLCWVWTFAGLSMVVMLSVILGRTSLHRRDLNAFTLIIGTQVVMTGWRRLGQWLAAPAGLTEAEHWSAHRSTP